MTVSARSLTLRPIGAGDRALLLELYADTRAAELALTGWPDEQRRAFIDMQFTAQDTDYRSRFPFASFDVILLDGEPVGRLYVDRRREAIHVLDIIVAPARRGLGIGTALLQRLMDEAAASGRRVTLYVQTPSAAREWYDRLGFVADDDLPAPHVFMCWSPA